MDKKKAIQILTKAARLYKENLEVQKILFIYGQPSIIKKQRNTGQKEFTGLSTYEVAFHRSNFLHLTRIKIKKEKIASSIHFYELCLAGRLEETAFSFSKDGSTVQKLKILEHMMLIKNRAVMIGDFTDRGPKLYSEKVAGGTWGCMGFVQDKNTKLNVPNTLLNKDIRNITMSPTFKIYAIFSKSYNDDKYSTVSKLDKEINMDEMKFVEEIENMLKRY